MDDKEGVRSPQGDRWSPSDQQCQQAGEPTPPDVPRPHQALLEQGSGGAGAGAAVGRRRRRVPRACDECRRKKIKCDGKQPCENCAAFNEAGECTFDKPSKRRRSVPLHHLHHLESRLRTAESLLRRLVPHCDLGNADPLSNDLASFLGQEPQDLGSEAQAQAQAHADAESPESEDTSFIPLIGRIGQVDLNDDGEWDFHGRSSGASYFGHMTKKFPELLAYDSRIPFLPQGPRPAVALPLGSLGDWSNFGLRANPAFYELPPRQLARTLCEYSFNCATCILRTVHVPSFYRMFDSIYDIPSQIYSSEQRRFLGLLYAVLALGSMYDVDENDPSNPDHYAVAMDQGFKFYTSARLFLHDLTECRDMITLQALVFIIHFLQATSNLSECYTFVGIALRSALRMGLHRHLPHVHMTPIDEETRRRVFHVIQQMDIFLSTTIGLPLVLQDKDIDQPLPIEVNDEYITEHGILTPPPGTPSFFQAFNAHAKLMRILAKVVQHLYPPNGTKMETTNVTYMISYARIKEIEKDLHDWSEQLPAAWRPGPEGDVQVVRVRALLRFAYAHVQMMLYRPFLHYSPHETGSGDEVTDERSLACQIAGINVCRNIIHIGLEIKKQAVLIGPYWFIMYTQFLAVLSLVFYVLNNPDKPTCAETLHEAEVGKDAICGLSQRSLAADRVAAALQALFEKLPSRLGKTRAGTAALGSGLLPAEHNPILWADAQAGSALVEPLVPHPIVFNQSHRNADPSNIVSPVAITPEPGYGAGTSAQQPQNVQGVATTSLGYDHDSFTFINHPANVTFAPPEDPFAYPQLGDFVALTGQRVPPMPYVQGGQGCQDSIQLRVPGLYDDVGGPAFLTPLDLMDRGQLADTNPFG